MFQKISTINRFLAAAFVIVFSFGVLVYAFTVPIVRDEIFRLEEDAARTILDNVSTLLENKAEEIEDFKRSSLEAHRRELRNITLVAYNHVRARQRQLSSAPGGEQAKTALLEELRNFRYGNNDYVWVSDYSSRLISHPDRKLHKADFSKTADIHGRLIVPPMVSGAIRDGEGYHSYWWRRLDTERPVEKLSFYKDFSEWRWVIGTGVYVDDIEREVQRRREEITVQMRKYLQNVRVAGSGYFFVFDGRKNMIIHPDPALENHNLATTPDPLTGKPILERFIASTRGPDNRVAYRWDRPGDREKYVYDKVAWTRHISPFGWYVTASAYSDDLRRSAGIVRNRILMVATAVFAISALLVALLVSRLLAPIRSLSTMARQVRDGNLDVRCAAPATGELGLLAATFNEMVAQLKASITGLDRQVRERTHELDAKNSRLEEEVAAREEMSEELRVTNENLTGWVAELEARNREIALINDMSDMLQSCRAMQETYGVIGETAAALFPGDAGALFMMDRVKGLLETAVSWGNYRDNEEVFAPEDCWCLRRGKPHRVTAPASGQTCRHIVAPPPFLSICLPLVGQGELLGMLHLMAPAASGGKEDLAGAATHSVDARERLAITVGDHLALALGNLKLREELHTLSVRDPLTGLFNRRYMSETLEREIKRAQRKEESIGMIVVDVDHFKKFNDSFGHETGDLVLIKLAECLRKSVREEDVACRYGGEEFVLLLPGANVDISLDRAERLRSQVENDLAIPHPSGALKVTISAGVAVCPLQGTNFDAIFHAADQALYQAKALGRNRVVLHAANRS